MAIHSVTSGQSVQAAIDAAQGGDVIQVDPTRYVEPLTLKQHAGPAITIRSAAVFPDRRITPADAHLLPTLAAGVNAPVITGEPCAGWILQGLNIEPEPTFLSGEAVVLQGAHDVTFDRCLIVSKGNDVKRGIRGNGTKITVTRCHIAGIWRQGQDSQAFCAWDGAGPYTLTDNYFEAASENVMFGGANSSSPANIPSNILFEGNHCAKPLDWKGQPRAVKNLFELKAAINVVIRGNLFEHNWTDAQAGYAVLITTRNDEGGSPHSVVRNVLFAWNTVRDTEHGINVLGVDSYQPSGRTTNIRILDNTLEVTGKAFQVGAEVGELVIARNTVIGPSADDIQLGMYAGDVWPASEGLQQPRPAKYAVESFAFTGNSPGRIHGDSVGMDKAALDALAVRYTLTSDVPPPVQRPTPDPDPVPVPPTTRELIAHASGDMTDLDPAKLTSKGKTNLSNIKTRLKTLAGQVR